MGHRTGQVGHHALLPPPALVQSVGPRARPSCTTPALVQGPCARPHSSCKALMHGPNPRARPSCTASALVHDPSPCAQPQTSCKALVQSPHLCAKPQPACKAPVRGPSHLCARPTALVRAPHSCRRPPSPRKTPTLTRGPNMRPQSSCKAQVPHEPPTLVQSLHPCARLWCKAAALVQGPIPSGSRGSQPPRCPVHDSSPCARATAAQHDACARPSCKALVQSPCVS